MMSSYGKMKIVLGAILFVVLIIAGYLFYLYQKGGVENYRPPATEAGSPKDRVINALTALSQAVDAYHAKNLRYPETLEQLQPEFIDKIPLEPKTGKPFIYESERKDQYQIRVSDPASYGFKEIFVKNGKVYQN